MPDLITCRPVPMRMELLCWCPDDSFAADCEFRDTTKIKRCTALFPARDCPYKKEYELLFE
jgi:hypothetical protein